MGEEAWKKDSPRLPGLPAFLPSRFPSLHVPDTLVARFGPELLPLSNSYCHFIHLFYRRRAAPASRRAAPLCCLPPLLSSISCVECGLRFAQPALQSIMRNWHTFKWCHCCYSTLFIDRAVAVVSRRPAAGPDPRACCTVIGAALEAVLPIQEPPATCTVAGRGCTCSIVLSRSHQMAVAAKILSQRQLPACVGGSSPAGGGVLASVLFVCPSASGISKAAAACFTRSLPVRYGEGVGDCCSARCGFKVLPPPPPPLLPEPWLPLPGRPALVPGLSALPSLLSCRSPRSKLPGPTPASDRSRRVAPTWAVPTESSISSTRSSRGDTQGRVKAPVTVKPPAGRLGLGIVSALFAPLEAASSCARLRMKGGRGQERGDQVRWCLEATSACRAGAPLPQGATPVLCIARL
jgi:hypothetical protein